MLRLNCPTRPAPRLWMAGTCWSVLLLAGCGAPATPPAADTAAPSAAPPAAPGVPGPTSPEPAPSRKFAAVELGPASSGSPSTSPDDRAGAAQLTSVVQALQPLQVLLGTWRGTTNKKFDGFNNIEELEWVWDFRTEPNQPALVMKSDKSPYIRQARLTWLPSRQEFQLTLQPPTGAGRTLTGTFIEEPAEEPGENGKPQRTFKLQLTEVQPADGAAWQVVFNQRENNRYLLEFSRKAGTAYARFDTVGTQREGTSFAANDEDYGDRKCIISGGLGTISVSYKGKSYWVCCTGCQSAFNDNPEKWLARLAEQNSPKP